MTLQKFSIEAVQKARQHICAQLTLPESEQQPVKELDPEPDEDTPEPDSLDALGNLFRAGGFVDVNTPAPNVEGKWFISTIDPTAAVKKLPGLSIKTGVRLVTYLQRQAEGGLGITWALPDLMSTTAQLENALATTNDSASPPQPQGALSHVMESIEGDSTPASFLMASLLTREWRELGRTGKNHRWSQHRLIATVPFEQQKQAWQWQTQAPKNLAPKVKIQEDRSAIVEFFSCRIKSPVAIFRHLDHYPPNSYLPKVEDRAIAVLQISSTK